MKTITLQSLDSILDMIDDHPKKILWIRNIEDNTQVYVSGTFTSILGYERELLYRDPLMFNDILIDKAEMLPLLRGRILDEKTTDTSFIQLCDKNNKIHYFKDQIFSVVGEDQKPLGFSGICERITYEQWMTQEIALEQKNKHTELYSRIAGALKKEARASLQPIQALQPDQTAAKAQLTLHINGQILTLSQRQKQCIDHLLEGKSAKQTACAIHLSQRTVEEYLDNIRKKINCRNKLELIKILSQSHTFSNE